MKTRYAPGTPLRKQTHLSFEERCAMRELHPYDQGAGNGFQFNRELILAMHGKDIAQTPEAKARARHNFRVRGLLKLRGWSTVRDLLTCIGETPTKRGMKVAYDFLRHRGVKQVTYGSVSMFETESAIRHLTEK